MKPRRLKKKRPAALAALEAASAALPFLRGVLGAPTFVAVGLDPEKGVLHACIRNGNVEKTWKEPLTGQARAVFDVVRGLLAPPEKM